MTKLDDVLNKLKEYKFLEPNKQYAFYDTDSLTAIEQAAYVRGLLKACIEEMNDFVACITATIEDYAMYHDSNAACFKKNMICEMNKYHAALDIRVDKQDAEIKTAVDYFKSNILTAVEDKVTSMLENGEFDDTIISAMNEFMGFMRANMNAVIENVETNRTDIITNKANILLNTQAIYDNKLSLEDLIAHSHDDLETQIGLLQAQIGVLSQQLDALRAEVQELRNGG